MKEALEHIINDAYERGRLDAELGVSSDLSLFAKGAAAEILGTTATKSAARYIPDSSIVELPDGRLGVLCSKHGRRGYKMVSISQNHGVEVRVDEELIVRKFPQELARQLVRALWLVEES